MDATTAAIDSANDRWLARATWAFVALGILLRLDRYLMNFPLWWDESFVAVNFLRRGYLDLLRPLDFDQVGPLLFLWIELSVVRLLGFSEWTLRLFPCLCAGVSVILVRWTAGRVLRGTPLVLAVAIFAVSDHPIRHAADAKPYASDLLVAVGMLGLALSWRRAPHQTGWLWALAALTPLALALSYPAAFVAGGLVLALAPAVGKSRNQRAVAALGVFGLAAVATFLILFRLVTQAQSRATLGGMRGYWSDSFPPCNGPLALLRWLIVVHTGPMLAYPCGGERGASAGTLLLVIIGGCVLWRRRNRTTVAACWAPLGLALVAAALRRYPYGGAARFMQYAAPGLCLLAGAGAGGFVQLLSNFKFEISNLKLLEYFSTKRVAGRAERPRERRVLRGVLVVLAVVGIVPSLGERLHPYRAVHAQRARAFARWFWPELARGAEVACLRWDFGVGDWSSVHLDIAVYLCNQKIYSPQRRDHAGPRWSLVSASHPLRCVASFRHDAERPARRAWLNEMRRRYHLRDHRIFDINMAAPGAAPRTEHYEVFEFVPKPGP
jgi:hypothetical protein